MGRAVNFTVYPEKNDHWLDRFRRLSKRVISEHKKKTMYYRKKSDILRRKREKAKRRKRRRKHAK